MVLIVREISPKSPEFGFRNYGNLPAFYQSQGSFLVLRIGLPASDSPVDSDDHQGATSQWCTSTIQKLASFTVSVLRENTQLRECTTTTGTTKAGTPRSQASADEAGGQPMKLGVVQRGINEWNPFCGKYLTIHVFRDIYGRYYHLIQILLKVVF